jgi:hypothetical protein
MEGHLIGSFWKGKPHHTLLDEYRLYLKLGLLRGLADQHCFTSSLKP